VWPWPARHVTRFCARVGITPNQVTMASLAFVIVAFFQFRDGHYGAGLIAAWVMTFLDTVDGKLARVTLQSSKFGDIFDHGIDLIHPPFWWWAWISGLATAGFALQDHDLVLAIVLIGYVAQRIEEGLFQLLFGIAMHVWRPFDSFFRLITARRNPNLLILTVSVLFGRPDIGMQLVAAWVVICFVIHALRIVQGLVARRRGPLSSWLAA
jgi:phosphatidylglycerophosphate synthase